MELYDRILQSQDERLAKTCRYTLKKQYNVLNKTMTGIFMTMNYGDSSYEKELSDIEEQMNKIDNCLSLAKRK